MKVDVNGFICITIKDNFKSINNENNSDDSWYNDDKEYRLPKTSKL